jgi:hypothetical protein
MRWAIMRYSELATSVSCMSKSTFIPTMLESASIWKNWTASEIPFSMSMRCASRVTNSTDQEGPQRFVLALQGELGSEEEVLIARRRYLIRSAGLHS